MYCVYVSAVGNVTLSALANGTQIKVDWASKCMDASAVTFVVERYNPTLGE